MRGNTHARRTTLSRAPLAAAIWLAIGSTVAIAQDTAPTAEAEPASEENKEDGAVLDTITVTAQKRSENLQEVPISIQVLGNEQIEEMGIADFDDVVKLLPSVSFQRLGEVPGLRHPVGGADVEAVEEVGVLGQVARTRDQFEREFVLGVVGCDDGLLVEGLRVFVHASLTA